MLEEKNKGAATKEYEAFEKRMELDGIQRGTPEYVARQQQMLPSVKNEPIRQTARGEALAPPPTNYRHRADPQNPGRYLNEYEAIPGSADAEKIAKENRAEQEAYRQSAGKSSVMLDLTKSIRDEIKGAWIPASGTGSQVASWNTLSAAGRVASQISALQSGVALNAMLELKKASPTGATGFGALNREELNILINSIGALRPESTPPDILLKTLDEIDKRYINILKDVRKNVSPEVLKELQIGKFLQDSGEQSSGGSPIDDIRARAKSGYR